MTTKDKAVSYWQDRLAKFFPTSKGPTGCEVAMFEAGYALAKQEIQEQDAKERAYREQLESWILVARERLDPESINSDADQVLTLRRALSNLVDFLNDETSYPPERPHPLYEAERVLGRSKG